MFNDDKEITLKGKLTDCSPRIKLFNTAKIHIYSSNHTDESVAFISLKTYLTGADLVYYKRIIVEWLRKAADALETSNREYIKPDDEDDESFLMVKVTRSLEQILQEAIEAGTSDIPIDTD